MTGMILKVNGVALSPVNVPRMTGMIRADLWSVIWFLDVPRMTGMILDRQGVHA